MINFKTYWKYYIRLWKWLKNSICSSYLSKRRRGGRGRSKGRSRGRGKGRSKHRRWCIGRVRNRSRRNGLK